MRSLQEQQIINKEYLQQFGGNCGTFNSSAMKKSSKLLRDENFALSTTLQSLHEAYFELMMMILVLSEAILTIQANIHVD